VIRWVLAGGGFLDWTVGAVLMTGSLLGPIAVAAGARRIRRARTFYGIETLIRVPRFFLMLAGGAEVLGLVLPAGSMTWLWVGLLLGLAPVPEMIRRRRSWIHNSLARGHLQESFDRERPECVR
jgi:hypothetical protein